MSKGSPYIRFKHPKCFFYVSRLSPRTLRLVGSLLILLQLVVTLEIKLEAYMSHIISFG